MCWRLLTTRAVTSAADAWTVSDAFEATDLPLLEVCCAQLEGKTQRQTPHPKGSLAHKHEV